MPDGSMNLTGAAQAAGELVVQTVESEPRVRDVDLAKRLGFAEPTQIRKLIERHKEILSKISVLATVEETPGPKGGRPSTAYYLNRKQAMFITAKSETDLATDITIEIIRRFDAYEQGTQPEAQQAAVPAINLRDPNQLLALGVQLTAALAESQGQVQALEANVAVLEPKAEAWDAVAEVSGLILLSDYARAAGIRQGEFFDLIEHKLKWCFRTGEEPKKSPLKAKFDLRERGWLVTRLRAVYLRNSRKIMEPTTYLTPAGVKHLTEILLRDGVIIEAPQFVR